MDSLESLTAKTAEDEAQSEPASTKGPSPVASQKEVNKFASTFAPRASGSTGKPNPAFKGSWLYTVFDVQAWLALVVGGLLSFNVIFPSDEPDIARLMGMWSIWMFTIPSLRAESAVRMRKMPSTSCSSWYLSQTCCCLSSGRTLVLYMAVTLLYSLVSLHGKGIGWKMSSE